MITASSNIWCGGGAFFLEGRGAPGGELPVNTYGSLLSFGHTGNASGMPMIVAGVRQVMGRAEARGVPKAEVMLVHAYGGMMSEHCTPILGREPTGLVTMWIGGGMRIATILERI